MSEHHDDSGIKYEFKHDTDNFTIFSALLVSIAGVTLIMAFTLLWVRHTRDTMNVDDNNSPYVKLEELQKRDQENLKGIDEAMKQVVQEYNK